jgi:low temperature requirement protein LtrA
MSGRKLVGAPILLQDWDSEAEEGAAKYWELFLDLLMVAAASAVADGLKEDPTLLGVRDFLILILLFINGSTLYTHMTTRFEDGTFIHIMILFLYIFGFATCIVNASIAENPTALAAGALLQRFSISLMTSSVYISIPRARKFCRVFAGNLVIQLIILTLVIFFNDHAVPLLSLSALIELFLESILSILMKREETIPINIEHSKDRFGILLLVMLGETVISATIEHRRIVESAETLDFAVEYYWVLFWALVLVFFYTLLFFAITPPPAYHAFRRSRAHGVSLMVVHKLLCASVLAVGVCVKLTIESIVKQKDLSDFTINLMSISVGCSFTLLVAMRMLHFLGVFPTGKEPPDALRLMYTWWVVIGVAALLPFLGLLFRVQDPVSSIAMYAGLLFGVCLVESTFTHILEPYLIPDARIAELLRLNSEVAEVSYQSTA